MGKGIKKNWIILRGEPWCNGVITNDALAVGVSGGGAQRESCADAQLLQTDRPGAVLVEVLAGGWWRQQDGRGWAAGLW